MKRKILAALLASVMVLGVVGCGGNNGDTPDEPTDGGLIKVGIINNDPNESGYRTANDKDCLLYTSPSAAALQIF